MIIPQLNNEGMDWNLTYIGNNGKDDWWLYENGTGKKLEIPN